MNKFLTVLFAVCAMAQVSHAQEANRQFDDRGRQDSSDFDRPGHGGRGGRDDGRGGWDRGPGRGPGHGPGRDDGWGRGPGHGPGRPGPGRPGPGPRPPHYPPSYRTEYFKCGNYGFQFNECYINSFRMQNIRLYRQDSREACIYGRTYGFNQNRIWTSNACRAVFEITYY